MAGLTRRDPHRGQMEGSVGMGTPSAAACEDWVDGGWDCPPYHMVGVGHDVMGEDLVLQLLPLLLLLLLQLVLCRQQQGHYYQHC